MKTTRNILLPLLVVIIAAGVTSCRDDDDKYFDMMPAKIQAFVVRYYPNPTVGNVTKNSDGWYVRLQNGPEFWFDTTQDWYRVDGLGMPLPEVFAFDQFPEPLYDYLLETENTQNVFGASRTKTAYKVNLLDDNLDYDIATTRVSTETPVL